MLIIFERTTQDGLIFDQFQDVLQESTHQMQIVFNEKL